MPLHMLTAAVFLGSLAVGALILAGSKPLLKHLALRRVNYSGREVPTSAGILFVPVYLSAYVAARALEGFSETALFGPAESLLVLVVGMCFLGFLDDILGHGEAGGFKGHFGAALKGRITTGFMKAMGGFLLALAASFPISLHFRELFLNAAVIALFANLFNLLDMRPGRALKVFFPVLAGMVVLNVDLSDAFLPHLLSVGAAGLLLLPGDLKERFMLGDAGSNVLGAALGLAVAVGAGQWWKLGVLVFLVFLNVLSEKYSFSRMIGANRVLNWMDRLGGKGERSDEVKY